MLTLPAFYCPSTIAWIDDDALFLRAISQTFRSHYPLQTFNHPNDCLHFFATYTPPIAKSFQPHADIAHEHYDTTHHSPVDFDITTLPHLHENADRTKEISVIIVDYQMPGMNGLELCRKLHTLPCKKILLTGEADHRDAVAAFNDNIIDRFIRKDSPTLVAEIQKYIATLSQQYFRERTQTLIAHLEANYRLPLSDPIFIDFFHRYCNAHDIREYSILDKNGSFLVIDQHDQSSYLIIHTDRSLNAFIELHDDTEEAKIYLTIIKNREKIPFFGVGKENWDFEPSTWSNYFYPPEIIEGREKYYWAAIKMQ